MTFDFHFLRPAWLLALVAAPLLVRAVSRREDVRARWRGTIAPHLLDHLVVARSSSRRVRPVHLTALLIALGAIALAGPTWRRERPPFVEDRAPLAIALDLSPTMDAIDVSPTRLERAKLKVHDLLALRPGARTAIFGYAGSAHMVLPLTDDAELIRTYVDALATSLMPVPGKDTTQALRVIDDLLAHEDVPGTIVFLTDGVEPAAVDAVASHGGHDQIMVLGIGTTEGGPVRTGADTYLDDAAGQRVFAKLDVDALRKLERSGKVAVATVTPDDADVRWVVRRAQSHLEQKTGDDQARWQDEGYWLVLPIALLSALWFRRGWTVRWVAVLLCSFTCATIGSATTAQAAGAWFTGLWLTPDQQGRLAYERGDFTVAAELFTDPLWRGAALYRAGKYDEALQQLARVDSAESDYDQGNALARLGKLPAAAARYRAALARRPDWPEAKANLALVAKLIPAKEKDDQQEAEEPNQAPDQVQFDEQGKQGKRGRVDVARQSAEMWMRGIQTTPAQLLQRKFALEVQRQAKP